MLPSPWNKEVVLSPELTWDSIQRGPERRETSFTFAILVWFETAFAKISYLRRRRNIFVDTKTGDKTGKKKSQIWKSYKNNKWIICSFSSIYWKTLEHVLNSVQLGFSSCGYYSLSHLHFFAFFFKKDMYLVTCSWLFIRHHLSTVCMFLPPQLSAFSVYLSLLSPRSPSPITHILPLRPTHRPHGKLERISIFRSPSIHL